MGRNRHLVTPALELSDLEGELPRGYRLADDGDIFSPGNCGARQKGWGEVGHGGVVVSLLSSDDGESFRNLARRKDPNAVVTEVQLPKTD
jgi:hypothetical protein